MKLVSNTGIALLINAAISVIGAAAGSILANNAVAQGAYDSASFNTTKAVLNVVRITPQGNDVPAGNRQIVFKFNQPVVAIGDMQRQASQIPVTITPQVNCQWMWLDTSSLSCQLNREDQLQEATKYSVTLNPGIKTVTGSAMSKPLVHTFITQRPKLENIYLSNWYRQNKPVAAEYFNQPVTKSSVENYIQLTLNKGQVIPIIVERQENPLTDRHYRRADKQSDFIEVDAIALGNSQVSKDAAIKRAEAERAGAYDQARRIWNITPSIE
jgi:hypothetical protein